MSDLFGVTSTLLPAISLWQPWASLCFVEDVDWRKLDETRHFPAPARLIGAEIAIHAAQRFPADLSPALDYVCRKVFGEDYRNTLPRGAIIGTVRVQACRLAAVARLDTTSANLAAGNFDDFTIVNGKRRPRFAWRLSDPSRLADPVPTKGRQGWFSVDLAQPKDTQS